MAVSELERSLSAFLDALKEYNLNRHTQYELGDLYKILYHRNNPQIEVHPFSIGILLETEYLEYGRELVNQICELLVADGLMSGTPGQKNEGAPGAILLGAHKIMVIENCKTVPADSKEYPAYRMFYEQLYSDMRKHKDVIVFAIVTPSVVADSWKHDSQKYYRSFPHHISLPDKTPQQIYRQVIEALEYLGFSMTNPFKAGIQTYVETIYPKAELKMDAFLYDLLNKIQTLYYTDKNLYIVDGHPKLTKDHVPFMRLPKKFEDVLAALQDMVGTDRIAEQFRKIYYTYRYHPVGSKLRMHMAFTGSPGTGKTTVARHMADMLYAMGALNTPKLTVANHEDLVSQYVGETPGKARAFIEQALDGVLFIDEAYAFANQVHSIDGSQSPEQQAVNILLQAMEQYSDRLVVIFAGYETAIEQLMRTNEGLRSRIGHFIHFPDFDDSQLYDIFMNLCEKNHIRPKDSAAQKAIMERIRMERSSRDFGNARSIENLFNEIFAAINEHHAGAAIITKNDVEAYLPVQKSDSLFNYDGFDEIKERIFVYANRAFYLHELQKRGYPVSDPDKHMLFIGNSGTGKSTAAKALASDLHRAGVLPVNRCTIIGAKDLSSFTGSGKQLSEFMIDARGGILFIDEAYALDSLPGKEEIKATLLTEMENHPETILIFAGYPYEMYQFVNSNPGFGSRISNSFYFPDYTLPELVRMYQSILQNYHFEIDDLAVQSASEVIRFFMSAPNFGNARFVRKLVDKTIENRALGYLTEKNLLHIENMHVPTIDQMKSVMAYGYVLLDPETISIDHKVRTAIHEMGHALMQMLLIPEIPVDHVTVEAGASYFGYMAPAGSPEVQTDNFFRNDICVCLGGRNAEHLIFGNHSTGCSQDYETAQKIARNMLQYAMGDKIGDTDIQPILVEADEKTTALLAENRYKLEYLAHILLEKTTLTGKELLLYSKHYDEVFK